jgi:HTH-type transcriptional regulator/antitoxin HipB
MRTYVYPAEMRTYVHFEKNMHVRAPLLKCARTCTSEVSMRVDKVRDLGLRLRDERQRAGLTQAALAERAGVSRRWLVEFESGKDTAEFGLALKVVRALGLIIEVNQAPVLAVDLDELLNNLGGPRA